MGQDRATSPAAVEPGDAGRPGAVGGGGDAADPGVAGGSDASRRSVTTGSDAAAWAGTNARPDATATHPSNDDILRRLKSVEGHVRGIERMVEEGAYCVDVMNQILAVQRALKKVGGRVLDRHLHHCVTVALRGDDPAERERVIGEVLEVFQATGRG